MQEKNLYEYAIIRLLPVVEREEFLNIGIILFCKKADYIKVYYKIDNQKIKTFSEDLDIDQIQLNLQSLENIALGNENSGPIALLDVPSRFRWLTAVRSSAIQMSRPHPGLSDDLDKTIKRLFEELVL